MHCHDVMTGMLELASTCLLLLLLLLLLSAVTCRPVGGPALRSLIDAHFDDNVVLKNPLFSVKGKEQL
jgi:hypothetical protein